MLAVVSRLAAGAATDRVSRVVAIAPSAPIHVDATIADVTITGSNRNDVRVDVERRSPGPDDLARFPVTIESRPEGVYIGVVQDREGRDASLKSTIAIGAPAGAVFQSVRVFEGRVRLSNLVRACDVVLRRGAIDGDHLAGHVRLESDLGGVDLRDVDLTPGGMVRLRVFNGPLRVRLARQPANARILAVTLNGAIASQIPLTMKDRFGPRFGESTLGTGDPVLSMDVVKGDISLTVGAR